MLSLIFDKSCKQEKNGWLLIELGYSLHTSFTTNGNLKLH